MAAHTLSSAPLPSRAPLLRLLLRRRGPAHSAAPAKPPVCSAPPRPRRAALFLGPGVGAGGRRRSGVGSRTMSASIYSTTVDSESAMTKNGGDVEPLPFVYDKHGGVIIEMTSLMDPQAFSASLKSLLSKWREQGIRGVWIKLPISLANLIQSAVEEGFCFVMNDKREVLVVQEKSGVLKGLGIWKFPTGVVEPGEDINIGVVREVKEETGVDAEFVEVVAFRQSHKAYFEKSDLFFVCILRPLSVDITKQESEIEDAQWMPWRNLCTTIRPKT
ncbi:hypothetical protein ZWY2020_002151 [Hordeum vulgare]|nr:hypothetical protein ZWY2020_002151 [Hordeum vulgare]